ncbi:hypothetical protein BPO_1793 [Bergeyella porcorum]|uniref:Glycosyltransferase 2-like domain-containing protein n=1 Tax=Bergeyella porcorum TaxID=1735111 RepID=A0AAU0F4R4_9FLAO
MKFSILIAHYNNFEYFKDCFKSIINQTFQDFEVIIVDDYSTDGSFEKIKELVKEDSRFKIFRNEENKGVGYTKKKCIELANGEICGFLDPDDALATTALEDAINTFSSEITAVYSKIQICDNQLKFIKLFPGQKQVKNDISSFLNIFFEVNHFFVFKREDYLKTEGINPELTSAVDQDLYLKLYEIGKFKFIPKANYIYRLHDKGVSQAKSKKDTLNHNWHIVLQNTLKRRNITKLYGKKASKISNLPKFVFEKENTFLKKLLRIFQ